MHKAVVSEYEFEQIIQKHIAFLKAPTEKSPHTALVSPQTVTNNIYVCSVGVNFIKRR